MLDLKTKKQKGQKPIFSEIIILFFLFLFPSIHPKTICKEIFFLHVSFPFPLNTILINQTLANFPPSSSSIYLFFIFKSILNPCKSQKNTHNRENRNPVFNFLKIRNYIYILSIYIYIWVKVNGKNHPKPSQIEIVFAL